MSNNVLVHHALLKSLQSSDYNEQNASMIMMIIFEKKFFLLLGIIAIQSVSILSSTFSYNLLDHLVQLLEGNQHIHFLFCFVFSFLKAQVLPN